MSKHTPGPWQEVAESGDWWITSINDDDPNAELFICGTNDTLEPDVALICAAPDLLAACEAVLNSDMAMREEDEGKSSSVLSIVRAAIAKATNS